MKFFFSGLQSLWSNFVKAAVLVVALGLISVPTEASAQVTTQSGSSVQKDMSAREYFGLREYIRGIQLSEGQYRQLKDFGCTLSPTSFVPTIVEKAIAGGYMCSRQFFQEVGKKNTAGTMYDITYVGAGGATVVKTIKGNKVGQNYVEVSTFTLSPNGDGKPLTVTYNYHANGGQYMAQMLSSLPGTVIGATLPALTAALVNGFDGQCQSGIINIVSAGSNSSSNAQLQSTQTSTVAGTCGTTGCK